MDQQVESTTIKKYANRRLYNTGTSSYVTRADLAEMVKSGENFRVVDAKSGDEITRSVLTQIICEQENKGQNLLPIAFLRQLIRFYGNSIQNLIPTYLDFSINSLVREQEKLRTLMLGAFPPLPFGLGVLEAINDQVRRNTEMFGQTMRTFLPVGAVGVAKANASATTAVTVVGENRGSSQNRDVTGSEALAQKTVNAAPDLVFAAGTTPPAAAVVASSVPSPTVEEAASTA